MIRRFPPMEVEFYPNTGSEVGWQMALERELMRRGWTVVPEVRVPSVRGIIDLVARKPGAPTLIIEVKRDSARPPAVVQLRRYLTGASEWGEEVLGVLAAPRLGYFVRSLPDDMYFLPLVMA